MICFSNPECEIIAHSHTAIDNEQVIFNVPCFAGISSFDIAHDKKFRGLFVETNKLGSKQKKITRRKHNMCEEIQKQ